MKACPGCYPIQLTPEDYLAQLNKLVIEPVKLVQNLVDAHPQITRLYTTLSADEMTLDPLFSFNADLPELSNVHSAERVIACNPSVYAVRGTLAHPAPAGTNRVGHGQ